MDKITVRQGETLQIPVTIDDSTATTATLSVWDDEGVVIIEETGTFVDNETTIDAGVITQDVGEYNYGLQIEYSDGEIDSLPDSAGCDGDCEFPVFEICEGIPEGS